MMFVRLGLVSDLSEFVELARAAAEESASHLTFNEGRVRHTYQRYLDSANPTFFFVEKDRHLAGFLMATLAAYNFADGFYTTQQVLYVHPAYRGTRAAALLLDHFIRWSDELGALENTGGNDNNLTSDQTAKLLGRFGFEKVGHFVRRVPDGKKG